MAEITGGELKYIATIDTSQLDNSVLTSEGRLKGFTEVAEAAGKTLDNSVFKKRSPQDLNIFGLTKENIKIQKQVIEDIKKQIDELRDKASNVAPGMAQASIIGEIGPLKAELVAEEQALIRLQTELGETEQKQISLTTARNQALDTMRRLTLENKEGSEEYQKAEQNVLDYNKAIDQTNAKAKMLASGGLAGAIQNLSIVTGLMSTGVAITGLFTSENENLNRIMLKTQALLSATITLQQLQQSVTTSGIFGITSLTQAKNKWALVNTRVAASLGISTAAAKVLTATLTLGLSVAIIALIVAWDRLSTRQAKATEMNKRMAESVAEPMIAYKNLQLQWDALGNDLKAKEKFIKDNQDQFEALGVSVNKVTDAENVFVKNSTAMMSAMMLRAKAAAAMQLATEQYKKGLQAELDFQEEEKILKTGSLGERMLVRNNRNVRLLGGSSVAGRDEIAAANKMTAKSLMLTKAEQDMMVKNGIKPYEEIEKIKKEKKKKSKKEEVEEFFPAGSVAEIQKRLSDIDEALSKATGSKSIESLKKQRIATALELAAAEKKIRIKSFDDEMSETKKQIELRDKLIQEGYEKENVDKMLPEVKDKTYLQYLEETAAALKKLMEAGDGTEETAENLTKTAEAIEQFKGYKSYVDQLSESIDGLKSKYSGLELIDRLEQLGRLNVNETEAETAAKKIAIDQAIELERTSIRNSYIQILEEQRTHEEQKLALQKKYDAIRLQATTEAERNKVEAAFSEELSALNSEMFKKTDLYAKAFGNLERVGTDALQRLRESLAEYLEVNKDLSPENIKVIQEAIEKIDSTIGDRNPFLKLSNALDEYKKKRKELADAEKKYGKESDQYKAKLDEVSMSFGDTAQAAGEMASIFISSVQEIGNAFGSLSDEANQTLTQVQNLLDGVIDAVKGYFSGNYAQMLAGIVQIISAIVKLANGDIRRAKNVEAWQREVNELALAYERLQQIIEKTAGEANLAKQRELIANLQKQQDILRKMRNEENAKKKADKDKSADYTNQIAEINFQIESLVDNFKESVTTVEFKSLSEKLADALTSAWLEGGNAAQDFGRIVDDVMRQAVQNALRIKFLEPAVQKMVDQLYASMGFGGTDDADLIAQIKAGQDSLAELEAKLAAGGMGWHQTAGTKAAIATLKEKIAALQAQLAANQQAGAFDGLTDAEREAIKAMGVTAMEQYTAALAEYEELFGSAGAQAQGLKGDIKGITEKTAGALEAQMNAIRIYQVEAVNIHKKNQDVFIDCLKNLVMIEFNTRRLHSIDDGIKELNSKVKKSLAGVP